MPSQTSSSKTNSKALQRIRLVGHMLDNAVPIPGTSYRVGLDPILGLLPGGGDLMGVALSLYIVLEAARFRLPRATLVRMVTNLALDSMVGTLPVLGDFFDFTWKANSRNVALLEAHLSDPHPQPAADRGFVILAVAAAILIGVGAVAVIALVVGLVWRAIVHG